VLASSPNESAPDEALAFERMSFALASMVELDAQGRLLISEKLRKRAGLEEKITLVGVRDHIELWDTGNWEKYIEENMAQYQKQMSEARKTILSRENKQYLGTEAE